MSRDEVSRESLGDLEYIAEGGQGKVYRCLDFRVPDCNLALAYKEYKPKQVTPAGLESLIGMRSNLEETARMQLDYRAMWPLRLVKESGAVKGILMPYIPDEFMHVGTYRTGGVMRKEREVQFLFLAPERCDRLGYPRVNLFQRLAVCHSLASTLVLLGEHNVIFGDLNAKNELFCAGPGPEEARVILVDCDAARIRGSMSAVQQLNSPDWDPPDKHLTHETDIYKFGLFVIRVLSPGPNASTARDPRRVTVLDLEGHRLLGATVGADPKGRPTAEEWASYFVKLRAERRPGKPRRPAPAATPHAPKPPGPPNTPAANSGGWVRGPDGEWMRRPS